MWSLLLWFYHGLWFLPPSESIGMFGLNWKVLSSWWSESVGSWPFRPVSCGRGPPVPAGWVQNSISFLIFALISAMQTRDLFLQSWHSLPAVFRLLEIWKCRTCWYVRLILLEISNEVSQKHWTCRCERNLEKSAACSFRPPTVLWLYQIKLECPVCVSHNCIWNLQSNGIRCSENVNWTLLGFRYWIVHGQ